MKKVIILTAFLMMAVLSYTYDFKVDGQLLTYKLIQT